jgi:hypothetical protein
LPLVLAGRPSLRKAEAEQALEGRVLFTQRR